MKQANLERFTGQLFADRKYKRSLRRPNTKVSAVFIILICLCLPLALLFAQTDFSIGSIIKGFEMPQHDSQGQIKAKIHGKEATVMTSSRIKVRGLKIEFFEKGDTVMEITSTQSDFWRSQNRLTTDKGVKIIRPGLIIEAEQMDWELAGSKGNLKGNVKVKLTNQDDLLVK
ncbi:MAG: hypothetical protein AAGA18_03870 [Verrucomicrobiota bacterium]